MAVTTNYSWNLPTINGDADAWGTKLNANWSSADTVVFGKLDKAGGTLTGALVTLASGTGGAGFNLPHGAAPSAPTNGDAWTTTAGAFIRINGATKTLFFAEGGTVSGAATFGSTVTLSADPVSGLQAATKQYVDSVATGLQVKTAAALATTANVTLSGEQTIDGTLTSATRLLVKNQTAPAENGVYTTGAGAWTRTTDMDAWSEVTGALVFVTGGSTNAGKRYYSTATAGGTLGTTAINFVLYDSVTSYTGSGGITLSGSDFRLSDMTAGTFKGRASGAGTGAPTDLTATQATAILNPVVGDSGSGGTKGLVPAPAAGDAALGKYLDAAGTFSNPRGKFCVFVGQGSNGSCTVPLDNGMSAATRTAKGNYTVTFDVTEPDTYYGVVVTTGQQNVVASYAKSTAAVTLWLQNGNGTVGSSPQDPSDVTVLIVR